MPVPPAVANFRVTATTYTSITVSWDLYVPQNTVNNFHIYVGLTAGDRTNMISRANGQTTYTISVYPFSSTAVLPPGTNFYITIVGHSNSNGTSPDTQLQQTTDVLAAPTGFICPTQFRDLLVTQWTAYPKYTSITQLNYRWGVSEPPTTNIITTRSLTSKNLNLLISNTRYYIYLTAQITQTSPNPTYESPPAILTAVTTCDPPTNLIILPVTTPTSITISWTNPVSPATYILLAISPTAGVFTNTITLTPPQNTYVWTNLIPDTHYYFRVQNQNQIGINTGGIFADANTSIVPPLVSIQFANITASGFLANLVYDPIMPDEIGFKIGTLNPPAGDYIYQSPQSQLVFDGLNEDTNYFLQIVARISGVNSTPIIQGVYTSNAMPSNFTSKTPPTVNSVLMGWDPSPSPTTGYNIWISTVENDFSGQAIVLGVVEEYEFTGLTAETTYFFKLVDLGTGSPSEPTYSVAITAAPPVVNSGNLLLYVYKATHGFKYSTHSPQRSLGRPIFRQIRGGW